MDGIKLKRALVTLSFVLGAVAIASYGIRASKAVIYWMVVFFPVAVFFAKDPRSIFIFGVMASLAWLRTPGLTSKALSPFNLAAAALLVSTMALVSMKKIKPLGFATVENWLLGFLGVIFITMAARGAGFMVLGDTNWGGGQYVNLILLICFYLSMRNYQYTQKQIQWLIWGSIFATGALALAQFIFFWSGGTSYGITNFMQIQAENAAGSEMLGNEAAMSRFTHFRWLAYALLPLAFFWPKRRFLSFFIVGVSVFLMFMTGFRIEVVSIGMTYLICGVALSKQKGRFFWGCVILGLIGYILLLLFAGFLPEAATRSISFLPGIEVADKIAAATSKSTNWRFEVWGYCLREAPKYLFIGRGVTFNVLEWAWLQGSVYFTPEFFFATHGYHNGPLALLVDFGILGLLTMSGFFFSSWADILRRLKEVREKDNIYYKFAVYLASAYIWMVIKFYLIYGDYSYYLTRMVILYVMFLATINYLRQRDAASLCVENADIE